MNKARRLLLGLIIIVLTGAMFLPLAAATTAGAAAETTPALWVSLLLVGLNLVGLGLLAWEVRLRLGGKSLFPRGSREQVVWGGLDILSGAVFFLFTTVILHLVISFWMAPRGGMGEDESTMLFLGLLPPLLTCLYVLRLLRLRGEEGLKGLGLKRRHGGKLLIVGVLGYVTFLPLLFASTYLVTHALFKLGYPPQEQEMVKLLARAPSFWFIVILTFYTIVVGPFVEEMLFRGFLQGYLCRRTTAFSSIALTSLIFAAVHGNLYASCQIFFLSLILGYVYHRTRSLVAATALHGLHNALQMLVLFTSLR